MTETKEREITKSLMVSDEVWSLLMKMRIDYQYKNMDELLRNLIKVLPASILNGEKKK